MGIDLPLIWLLIIGFSVLMYIVADGFDLGIGILFPWVRDRAQRDLMVNTVAPVWDGNETWLVLGGAGLMAAFPLAYAVVLSALYLPLLLMLLGLIWRGVSFEFRVRALPGHQAFWDTAFMLGSFVAAFFQGVVLGAFIDGIPVIDGQAHYGTLAWLTPFSVMTGLGVVVSYALLGATWLVMKTDGPLQARMIRLTRPATLLLLAAIAVVSVWTPWQLPAIAARWFSLPNLLWFLPVPVLVLLATWRILASLPREPHAGPFLWALLLVFLGFSGFVISLWPNIVPPDVSIRAAAGPDASLGFTLVGALLIVPVILAYTAWSYYVFRGKVTSNEGYH